MALTPKQPPLKGNVMNTKTNKAAEQTVEQAMTNLNNKGSQFKPKPSDLEKKRAQTMPDLNVSKAAKAKGDVKYLPSELGKVSHSPQMEMTIYGYFHLCNERGLVAGEAWISKQDINDAVIVDFRSGSDGKTHYTWFNFKTGETLVDEYVQDTIAQYGAAGNKKRYEIIAKQR